MRLAYQEYQQRSFIMRQTAGVPTGTGEARVYHSWSCVCDFCLTEDGYLEQFRHRMVVLSEKCPAEGGSLVCA
jgi:hypothetical protein